jgi:transposase
MISAKSSLTVEQSRSLSALSAGNHPRLAERAQVVLLSAEGHAAVRVAERLGVTVRTVYKWRQRFQLLGLEGLRDRARPGQPRRLSRAHREEIVRLTVEELPPEGQRWTIRSVAKRLGVTQHQVRKVWSENAVRPHLGRGSLVEERLLGNRSLRLRGLFVAPPYCVVALQLEAHAGASARLLRRVLPPGIQLLHRAVRAATPFADLANGTGDFAAFVGNVVDSVPDAAALHLLFPTKGLLLDHRTGQVLAKFPQLGASAKTSIALWADTLELWLEQTQKQGPGEHGIESLKEALRLFTLAAVEAGGAARERNGDKARASRPFVWIRADSAAGRSVGSVSVRSADL